MPESISHLPVNTPTPVRRWDLQLWQRVGDLGVQYADYGIAHPGMAGASWRPMPSLRYTTTRCGGSTAGRKTRSTDPPLYHMPSRLPYGYTNHLEGHYGDDPGAWFGIVDQRSGS